MRRRIFTTSILVVVFLIGLAVMLYPVISNYWNTLVQSRVVSNYTKTVNQMDDGQIRALMAAAQAYNEQLPNSLDRFALSSDQYARYNSILDVGQDGVIGTLTIPKISVKLPIYHGTDPTVLEVGLGHLPGSSFPIGGAGTHTAISGHRGLPSAELLSHIDRLVVGDRFQITVLKHVATYQVDQIKVVLPDDLDDLAFQPGQDLATLITCTPYGVNTHRLLVRGHRVADQAPMQVRTPAFDATTLEILIAVLLLVMVGIAFSLKFRKKKRSSDADVT